MKIMLLLCGILAACTFGVAKDKADVRDITGCLSKGDSAKEFVLTGNDGSTWEVASGKVALAEHVGHTVTATGVADRQATQRKGSGKIPASFRRRRAPE
jgi:hypothetical protein